MKKTKEQLLQENEKMKRYLEEIIAISRKDFPEEFREDAYPYMMGKARTLAKMALGKWY